MRQAGTSKTSATDAAALSDEYLQTLAEPFDRVVTAANDRFATEICRLLQALGKNL